ncbi:methyltransferase domain-containing protein [Elizabethkingia anophelis]|uniref:methyltransferase domain-containing protein n=1 Tax=Elizabethkingia anophelis TaxID=1117645 RepID=UPI002926DE07|nr:methyltransferase domain-containing protein [Elizabethkingia anophelis]MDV3926426.1 methyltransferase [Elizabethkingia anophelis]MDV4025297.1 methyltransferase [Elizabethkingia anophelis]WMC07138.1 MAG: carboxy-S-adenosyl-L-methionine synthase [Elizabethkingia anophelis]
MENSNWKFSGEIVQGFDSHILSSVPLYEQGHRLISNLSDFFLSNDSVCYELGCSTGSLLQSIAKHNSNKKIKFIGIDIEKDMVHYAQGKLQDYNNIEIVCDDILSVELEKSDMIISYYTIQFVKPRIRQLIFDKIYESLNWGGAFVLFEKVRGADARFQDILTALYTDFKLEQGFTKEEILDKTRSLKGVLEPFSTQGNIDLLQRAGFVDIMSIMKYVCFEGFLAIK